MDLSNVVLSESHHLGGEILNASFDHPEGRKCKRQKLSIEHSPLVPQLSHGIELLAQEQAGTAECLSPGPGTVYEDDGQKSLLWAQIVLFEDESEDVSECVEDPGLSGSFPGHSALSLLPDVFSIFGAIVPPAPFEDVSALAPGTCTELPAIVEMVSDRQDLEVSSPVDLGYLLGASDDELGISLNSVEGDGEGDVSSLWQGALEGGSSPDLSSLTAAGTLSPGRGSKSLAGLGYSAAVGEDLRGCENFGLEDCFNVNPLLDVKSPIGACIDSDLLSQELPEIGVNDSSEEEVSSGLLQEALLLQASTLDIDFLDFPSTPVIELPPVVAL